MGQTDRQMTISVLCLALSRWGIKTNSAHLSLLLQVVPGQNVDRFLFFLLKKFKSLIYCHTLDINIL